MQSLKLSAVGLFFFSCLFHVLYPAQAQKVEYNYCDTRNNYTSGSVFERNLNLTLSSLVSNASQIGFSTTVIGQNPNTVYGLLLCRGDISKEDCQACASTASKEIIRLCSDKKEAAVGYDYCSLRYSDSRFFSTVDSDPRLSFYNINNATEPVVFNRQLGNLVRTLSSSAASSTSKFAAGTTNYTDFLNINAMCCGGKQGGRVFSLSCNLRFEQYSFFLLSSPPPVGESSPPSSLVQRNSSSQEEASKVFVFVAIPVAVALVVALIAWQHWTNGTAMELLDPMLGDQLPKHEVLKCIYIGLLCVQEAAAARPTMSQIVLMLSSHIVTAPGPSRPAFYISRGSSDSDTGMEDCRTSQSQSQSNKSSPESLQQSVNEVTITELDPR
ncbi:hypothetical protein JRO89_XS01G0150800 [Xanthoceras sorbifolium]|uniref:Gnk2-homologous domain-containing protein n=1 Tax=Xanthoceras sorbifolium TaxID=99658 RepID=A0ABQ8IJH6_9ROSI|nr:hypothetical protein JRO89_XS01G0150800 [Xanthoceras sorbifolium]